MGVRPTHPAPDPGFREALRAHLDAWVRASLISREQAEAIRRLEADPTAATSRIPVVTEALGYVGALLALAAGIVVLERIDLSQGMWATVVGGAALALLVAGLAVRRSREPAIDRLMSVLWFLSVIAATAALGLWGLQLFDIKTESERSTLMAGAGSFVYAAALYAARRRGAQQLALFGASMLLIFAILMLAFDESTRRPFPTWMALSIWALGVVWLVLSWRLVVRPAGLGFVLGGAAVVIAPTIAQEDSVDLAIALGLASAIGLMVAGVAVRRAVVLGLGGVGLFGYLSWAIGEYLADSIGVPIALFVAGVVLLLIALATVRLRRSTTPEAGGPRRGPSPPEPGGEPGGSAPASSTGR